MAHMVEQIIKFSDGTETVISYRGQIVDGVLIPNEDVKMDEKKVDEVVETTPEAVETVSETPAETEVAEEEKEVE